MQLYLLLYLSSHLLAKKLPFTDSISLIETFPDSIVITTTKKGPADNLHIKIDVIDFYNQRTISFIDLYGPLLLLSRGRYTINYLTSNHWYGISFRSYNVIDGVKQLNVEEKLVRLPPNSEMPPSFGVLVYEHRGGNNGERLENLQITAQWTDDLTRKNLSGAIIDTSIICDHQNTKKINFFLSKTDSSTTRNVELESNYASTLNKTTNEVTMIVSSKSCQKMCWLVTLHAAVPDHLFKKSNESVCVSLNSVTATIVRPDVYDYSIGNGDFQIYVHAAPDPYGFINLMAFPMPPARYRLQNTTELQSKYSTAQRLDSYALRKLAPNSWYGIRYSYNRWSPFQYHEEQYYAVESLTANGTAADHPPVSVILANETVQNRYGVFVTPMVRVQRDTSYRGHDVLFNYRISCYPYINATNILLTDTESEQILQTINVTEIICSANVVTSICAYNIQRSMNRAPECKTLLCYIFQIKYNNSFYRAKERCVDILEHYVSHSSSHTHFYINYVILLYFIGLIYYIN